MTEMPRFDFSSCEFKSDDELNAALEAGQSKGSKYFNEPGQYEVTIADVEFLKVSEKDPNWGSIKLVYQGTGEKTVNDFLLVPFKTVKYGEKGTLFPFKKVSQFCGALGVEVRASNLGESMKTVFGRLEKLKGQSLKIDLGYRGSYVKYNRAGDEKYFTIVGKDGNVLRDNTSMDALKFADKAAALAYAESNQIAVERFMSVLQYDKSASGASLAASTGW